MFWGILTCCWELNASCCVVISCSSLFIKITSGGEWSSASSSSSAWILSAMKDVYYHLSFICPNLFSAGVGLWFISCKSKGHEAKTCVVVGFVCYGFRSLRLRCASLDQFSVVPDEGKSKLVALSLVSISDWRQQCACRTWWHEREEQLQRWKRMMTTTKVIFLSQSWKNDPLDQLIWVKH